MTTVTSLRARARLLEHPEAAVGAGTNTSLASRRLPGVVGAGSVTTFRTQDCSRSTYLAAFNRAYGNGFMATLFLRYRSTVLGEKDVPVITSEAEGTLIRLFTV